MDEYTNPLSTFSRNRAAMQAALDPTTAQYPPAPSYRSAGGPRSLFDDPRLAAMAANFGKGESPSSAPPETQQMGGPPLGESMNRQASDPALGESRSREAPSPPVGEAMSPRPPGMPMYYNEKPPSPYATPGSIGDLHQAAQAAALPDKLIPPAASQFVPTPGALTEAEAMGKSPVTAPGAADPRDLIKQIASKPAGPMAMLGGAAPPGAAPSMMQQFMNQLQSSANAPVSLPGEFQEPHRWSVGPARRMDETQQQAQARDDTDYAARLGSAQEAQKATQFNSSAQLSDRQHAISALTEIQKTREGKEPTEMDRAHLALEQRKVGLAENEAAYMKSPEKQREGELEKMQTEWAKANMSPADQALALKRVKKQWAAQDSLRASQPGATPPAKTPGGPAAAPAAGPAAAPTGSTMPPAGGPAPPPGPTGPKDIQETVNALPDSILSKLADPKDPSKNRSIEDFMTQLHQLSHENPGMITPQMAPDLKSLLSEKYGDASALKNYTEGPGDIARGLQNFSHAPWNNYNALSSMIPSAINPLGSLGRATGLLPADRKFQTSPQTQAADYWKAYFGK